MLTDVLQSAHQMMNGIGIACDRSGGRSHCRCLNAFTRDMISGRGFIGIAAQSLGMGRPVLPPHLGADLQRSQCGGLRCRASEGPRSWLPCCPMSSPNRGADAGRYAEKTRQIHTSPVPRMRILAPEAKKDPAGTACGVSFCCDFTHLRGAEPDRRRRQRMR